MNGAKQQIFSTYVLSCVVAGSPILNEHVRVAQRADNSRNRVRRWQKLYSTPLGADSIRMNLHFNGSFCISHSAPESYRRALADPFHDARGGGIRSVKELSVVFKKSRPKRIGNGKRLRHRRRTMCGVRDRAR